MFRLFKQKQSILMKRSLLDSLTQRVRQTVLPPLQLLGIVQSILAHILHGRSTVVFVFANV
jgi:hypothetical protein